MIGKLFLFALLAVAIQGRPQVNNRFNQEEGYAGPWLDNGCPTDFEVHWLLPHASKCDRFFYCVFGDTIERSCAPGTVFNPDANPGPVCDWPQNVDCGDKSVDNEDGNGSESEEDEYTGPVLENGCPSDFEVHQLLPHDNYCNKFYYCVLGNKVEGTCGSGTVFNSNAYTGPVCDWPQNVDCGDKGVENDVSDETDATEEDDYTGPWLENGCPTDFEVHQLLPHETYCNRFYYCVFGNKVERTCAPGTFFNPNANPGPVCDWPENVDCASGSGENNSNDNSSNDNNSSENNSNDNNTSENNSNDNNSNDNNSNDNNTSENNSNDDNTSANNSNDNNSSENNSNDNNSSENNINDNNTSENNSNDDNTSENNSNDNNSSENNSNDNNTSENTSNDNNSNESDSNDNSSGDDGDWLENGCPSDFNTHWLLPHERECNKFYYCVFGEKVERECAPGTYFNPNANPGPVCDWPENVDCSNGNGGSSSSNENSNENNSSQDNNSSDDNSGEDNEWLENGCPSDFNVHWLLPHETDCNKFYYCVFGEKVERDCAPGTYFNPNANPGPVCDWPENVDCSNRNSGSNSDENDSNDNNSSENNSNDNNSSENNSNDDDTSENNSNDNNTSENNSNDNNSSENNSNDNNTSENNSNDNNTSENNSNDSNSSENNSNDNNSSENNSNDNNSSENNSNDNNSNESDSNDNSSGEDNEWLENGCPSDFNVHWLLPHETDCNKFYYCVFGEKVERECAPGTYFNPNANPGPVCDWPENVDCSNGNGGSSSSNENSNENNSSEDNNSSDDNSGEDNEWLENGCPSDFNVHWLLPHETDCNKFYYCVFGEKVERECAPGTYFNPNANPGPVCDWPENVDCNNENDSGNDSGGDGGNSSGGDSSDDGDDSSGGDSGVDGGNSSGGDSSDDGDDSSGGDSGGDGGNSSGGDSSDEGNDSSGGNSGGDSGENSVEDSGEDNPCSNDCNRQPWAHETACDKLWRCENGEAVLVSCSEGLHFNANTGLCDFICNANCVRQHVQATAHVEGLKLFLPWDKVDEELRSTYHIDHILN